MTYSKFHFSDFPLVSTTKLEIAQTILREVTDQLIQLYDDGSDNIDLRINYVRLPKSQMFCSTVRNGFHAASIEPLSTLNIMVPITGRLINRDREQYLEIKPGNALVISPGEIAQFDIADNTVVLMFIVEDEVLRDYAQNIYGVCTEPELRFPSYISLNNGIGLSIKNILFAMSLELDDPESLFSKGITTKFMEEILITSLIHTIDPSSYYVNGKSMNQCVQRAVTFIRDNLKRRLTLPEVAAASRVCVATLHTAFTRQFGYSPMLWVRKEKLRRIRQELDNSDPIRVKVADIASKWGFFNTSHFASIYQKEFGELPSQTLLRMTPQIKRMH